MCWGFSPFYAKSYDCHGMKRFINNTEKMYTFCNMVSLHSISVLWGRKNSLIQSYMLFVWPNWETYKIFGYFHKTC